jgi:hypothetical protein
MLFTVSSIPATLPGIGWQETELLRLHLPFMLTDAWSEI